MKTLGWSEEQLETDLPTCHMMESMQLLRSEGIMWVEVLV